MKSFNLTKLGAALALTFAVAAPLVTALPASAHEYRADMSYGQRYDGQRHDSQRGTSLVRFDHRGEMDYGYRNGRDHARFQHYRWNWERHDHSRFGR
jgi:hypothetical protein